MPLPELLALFPSPYLSPQDLQCVISLFGGERDQTSGSLAPAARVVSVWIPFRGEGWGEGPSDPPHVMLEAEFGLDFCVGGLLDLALIRSSPCCTHPMNLAGLIAVALSLASFGLTYRWLQTRSLNVRLSAAIVFVVLAAPSFLFSFYYAHLLPERVWFYNLRSWAWSDFLVLFLGCAGGALASLLRPSLFNLPWLATVAIGVVPHLKPLIGPLPDGAFQELWKGEACLQSTQSTCGAASIVTILRHFGIESSERAIARAAYSYSGGTEAWYLARFVRSRGLVPRFDFRHTFTPEVGFPALVGVRLVGFGHFIAVLDVRDDQVTFADPLYGAERIPLSQFLSRYQFTGFHMVVSKGRMPD